MALEVMETTHHGDNATLNWLDGGRSIFRSEELSIDLLYMSFRRRQGQNLVSHPRFSSVTTQHNTSPVIVLNLGLVYE